MPRETVFIPYAEDPASGTPPFQIEVGWQRDQGVQVGISTVDDGSGQKHLVDYIYGEHAQFIGETMRAHLMSVGRDITDDQIDPANEAHQIEFTNELLGRMVLDAVTGSTHLGTSVWAHPDRAAMNRLIELSRKARNAAYGQDA